MGICRGIAMEWFLIHSFQVKLEFIEIYND